MAEINILEHLDAFRINDEDLAEGYEWAGPQHRALLKTAISLEFCYFDRLAERYLHEDEDFHAGIRKKILTFPKKQNFLIFDSGYAAAARICAAAILPLLAGASSPVTICINGKPEKAALCAMDIAGVGDAYQLTLDQAERMVIRQLDSTASIVFLHSGTLQKLIAAARIKQIPIYEEYAPPKLLLASPASFSIEVLKFVHGIENISVSPAEDEYYDAIFIDTLKGWQNLPCRLIIEPRNEGFWLFPNLTTDFFRQTRSTIGLIEDTSGQSS